MKVMELPAGQAVLLEHERGVLEIQNQGTTTLVVGDNQAQVAAGIGFTVPVGAMYTTPDATDDAGWPNVWVSGFGRVVYRRTGE